MQSQATTVEAYLASLPPDRRAAISALRDVIRANLDAGYEEGMQYGMIGYYVPHRVYPPGYHVNPKQPLPFAALASQKQHMAVYLMGLYTGAGDETAEARWFREAWKKTGKKLDMGKSCVRFKKLDDVALEVIGESIRRVPAKKHIARYEAARAGAGKGTRPAAGKRRAPAKPRPVTKPGRRASSRKPAPKRRSR